jgi:glutamate synthase domain-containing protein 2
MGKSHFSNTPFAMVWTATAVILALVSFLVATHLLGRLWLFIPLAVFGIVLYDSVQNRHALRRNYPLIGRLRYLMESIRPELRQYFMEGELDGKPFNRRQRSIVYQRAKNEKQTISFGMQDDPGRIGHEWAAHSIYPKVADVRSFRVTIGGRHCTQPYDASILNVSAMSFGALSRTAIMALNKGAALGGFAHNTGEGGISDHHLHGGDLIWQIGTGYFGCRDAEGHFSETLFAQKATLPSVKMIEIKLSQGAKPGHGGLLPAHKNTPEIARIRNIAPHVTVHSPATHTAFVNANGMLHFVHRLRVLSGGKPIGIKLCIGRKDEFEELVNLMVITGIVPDFITIDGSEGGTGAAPLEFIDHMGMALSDALVFADRTLREYGVRDQLKVLASGKVITAFDMAKNLALGADALYSARGMMFALGCIQALKCDSGKCPVGIATQDRSLYRGLDVNDKHVRVANYHGNTLHALADLLGACGFASLDEIDARSFFRRTAHDTSQNFAEIYSNGRTSLRHEELYLA